MLFIDNIIHQEKRKEIKKEITQTWITSLFI